LEEQSDREFFIAKANAAERRAAEATLESARQSWLGIAAEYRTLASLKLRPEPRHQ
jgi:hypothetical protein